MKLREKTEKWQQEQVFVGKKKNYKVTITYSPSDFAGKKDYWWFMINKDDYTYNSLWDKLNYATQEECVNAAENKIDVLLKQNLKEKESNE